MRNWLLPEYIEDVLPPEARRIEALRSRLLNLYRLHGYELVMPPLLEYLESLLTGTGEDLDLRTFKLVDQMSGRMMGIRADITPQVARIDAHLLNREGPTRLCYSGSVMHTRPRGINATREPLQIGAEVYGHSGIETDLEIQDLLYKSLAICGFEKASLDLGHVAIFRALCRHGAVAPQLEMQIYESLQSKDISELNQLAENFHPKIRSALLMLPRLYGDRSVLTAARQALPEYPEVVAALQDLEALSSDESRPVNIDLADLRGYHYHSGTVFAAYLPGEANPVAIGGRYDEVGKAFGRARPATGFSMDLRELARLGRVEGEGGAILAPYIQGDEDLLRAVEKLRGHNEVVVTDLPGHDATRSELGCDRELVLVGKSWQVRKL
jgi:ATP phosphoribosyltransferase regulatory subunit